MTAEVTNKGLLPLDIACVVVLYNPDEYVNERLQSYAAFLGDIFVIDNTDHAPFINLSTSKNNLYIEGIGRNDGLGRALNRGIALASLRGYKWVLLLDQDSNLSKATLVTTLKGIGPQVGIIAPLQITKKRDIRPVGLERGFKEILTTMTSGSILNISAFQECGNFEEKMFIDHIDHEYCLRLKKYGYKILECQDAVLNHSLGEVKHINVCRHKIEFTSHKPFRLYFFFRNGLYVSFLYLNTSPYFIFIFTKQCVTYLIKAVLFERDKVLRLRMIARGIYDWALGRYGRKYI